MKAAIAAFAVACVHQQEAILAGRGAVLLITGGEETGCDGARALIASATLPEVGALIVGEPTANYPVIGHKGALWLRCETRGKTAHGAMPELGSMLFILRRMRWVRFSIFRQARRIR
ncbi:acetylornithine deacetylase [Klebsiella pneumoniae]|nr:acetylornithine deacetylase [Klebsiella pneumoniae]